MLVIFNSRIYSKKVFTSKNGSEYVLLNVSKYAGKNKEGLSLYNEVHLAVWGQFDVELAKALDKGDHITFSLDNEKVNTWTDQNGQPHPYIQGNCVVGELCACYTNHPSAGLYNYAQRKEQQRQATPVVAVATPAAAAPATPVAPAAQQVAPPAPAAPAANSFLGTGLPEGFESPF